MTTTSCSAASRLYSPASQSKRSAEVGRAARRSASRRRPARCPGSAARMHGELALRLPAGADEPERPGSGRGQVPRGDRARGAGAELAQPVGLDQREQLRPVRGEEREDVARALGEARVGLDAGALELEIGGGHDVQPAVARARGDSAARFSTAPRAMRAKQPSTASTASAGLQELLDVGFAEVERHGAGWSDAPGACATKVRWLAVPADAFAGDRAVVEAGDREIVVLRVGGEVHAFDNACPHQGNPLVDGEVLGDVLECAYHGWRFDLGTGACLVGRRARAALPGRARGRTSCGSASTTSPARGAPGSRERPDPGTRPDGAGAPAARRRRRPAGSGRENIAFASTAKTRLSCRAGVPRRCAERSSGTTSESVRSRSNPHGASTTTSGSSAATSGQRIRWEGSPDMPATSMPPAAATMSGTQCPAE